ncbi:MAG: tellurite resistance protein [Halocynthiibacter sp.]|jgi:tellurite resistance protein
MQFNPKPPLWARTPPAIFPPILGLLGIGLAWRTAAKSLNAPEWIGEMLLGAVGLLFVFALLAYASKVARRPSVILDDLKILPGRAGIAAASLALMLFAAALIPVAPQIAHVAFGAAVITHSLLAILMIYVLLSGPKEQRTVTPIWHLSFVGFIVLPLAGLPLGYVEGARLIFWGTMPIAAVIWGISLVQFIRNRAPEPLRPLFAIHLSPLSLFAIVAAGLGYQQIAIGFAVAAVIALAALLIAVRWLTISGFSAMWGAFTFPMAAFCNAMLAVEPFGPHLFGLLGRVGLAFASIAVIWIAVKIMQAWTKGKLAVATNAAQA